MVLSLFAHAQEKPLLNISIEPIKRIYSSREGLMTNFIFEANRKTKLCVAKDIMTQMDITVSQAGQKVTLKPLVVTDIEKLYQKKAKEIWLEPGETISFRLNLRRLMFASGKSWKPGEYSINTTFHLCPQDISDPDSMLFNEIPIEATQPGWLMIMS